jgi:hypothetical protein
MTDDAQKDQEFDPIFLQMVTSLQAATMMQMGKIMNPQTGKVDRSMEHAQNTIDILAMMRRKMEGNLSTAEQGYLDHILYELRMNFVEESEKPATSEKTPAPDEGKSEETAEPKKDESPAESSPSA